MIVRRLHCHNSAILVDGILEIASKAMVEQKEIEAIE